MSESSLERVPRIVIGYWIIKIASTTLGETGADMFSMTFDLGYGVTIALFSLLFLVLLGVKMALGRFTLVSYWGVFTASAILGTAISDFIDRTLGLGYAVGSTVLLAALAVILVAWHRKEGSLSVEHIVTPGAELFYWAAFLVANTLGTAAGDFLADGLGIGFLQSAALIGGALALTALLHFRSRVSGILLFWVAFVLTRPFGATFGDLLTKPLDHGGLALGTVGASAFFALAMAVAMWREARLDEGRRAVPVEIDGRPAGPP